MSVVDIMVNENSFLQIREIIESNLLIHQMIITRRNHIIKVRSTIVDSGFSSISVEKKSKITDFSVQK